MPSRRYFLKYFWIFQIKSNEFRTVSSRKTVRMQRMQNPRWHSYYWNIKHITVELHPISKNKYICILRNANEKEINGKFHCAFSYLTGLSMTNQNFKIWQSVYMIHKNRSSTFECSGIYHQIHIHYCVNWNSWLLQIHLRYCRNMSNHIYENVESIIV